ncbi:AAA family ATPase [Streptomyces sp. NPDC005017]|uniref:AAA family ATPase n=1 Tax=Streptomyces sp. NPDC005017 TaxID=3364706 RepID=UPI0036B324C9
MTARLVRETAEAFGSLGYACVTSFDVAPWSARSKAGEFLRRHPDDTCIVYFAGHGHLASDGPAPQSVFPVDSPHPSDRSQSCVLFVLDTCGAPAGEVDRIRRSLPPDAWLILGTDSGSRRQAQGTFTRGLLTVLDRLRQGELDVDPTLPFVPLPVIASQLRRQMAFAGGSDVVVVEPLHVADSGSRNPPFFANPAYVGARRQGLLHRSLDPAVLPFVEDADSGLDPHHFMERASGSSAVAEHGRGVLGRFTGRRHELALLSDWLDDPDAPGPALVTGAPGAGKSALLGVLVSAAHPALHDRSRELWLRAAHVPAPATTGFAAVHARQRDLFEVCASVGRQLGTDVRTPQRLLEELRGMPTPPIVVVDALDEMVQSTDVMHQLLLPLTERARSDGRPLARILVATRPYSQYAPLLDAAAVDGLLIDLDRTPAHELTMDLAEYVTGILRSTRAFRHRGSVVHAFARELASTLVNRNTPELPWGTFLVAGLCARTFANSVHDTQIDPHDAAEAAHQVPHSLTEFLELELRSQPELFWLRPVLTALGAAHGLGMPVSTLQRVAPLFTAGRDGRNVPPEPSHNELRRTLQAARFYLRTATDSDGSLLYRLFHQSIADYLVDDFAHSAAPQWRRSLLELLLRPLGAAPSRDWQAAEPYVLRHALALATEAGLEGELLNDPEFLLHADPRSVREAVSNTPDAARLPLSIVQQLLDSRHSVRDRRTAASLTALRDGNAELATRLAAPAHGSGLPWVPRWTVRCHPSPARILALPADGHTELLVLPAESGDYAVLNGRTGKARSNRPHPLAFTHAERIQVAGLTVVRLTDSSRGNWIHEPGRRRLIDAGPAPHHHATGLEPGQLDPGPDRTGPTGPSVHALFDGLLVVCRGAEDGSVRLEDAVRREVFAQCDTRHDGPVTAVTCRYGASGLTVLTGGRDGAVHAWTPESDHAERLLLLNRPVQALEVTSRNELFVAAGDEIIAFRGEPRSDR